MREWADEEVAQIVKLADRRPVLLYVRGLCFAVSNDTPIGRHIIVPVEGPMLVAKCNLDHFARPDMAFPQNLDTPQIVVPPIGIDPRDLRGDGR